MSTKQQRIVFGYNRGPINQIELYELQAQVVKLIFMCYADGESLREIKRRLEDMRIVSPQNKPAWGLQTIANILSYDQYVGGDTYPPIIEKDLFDRVRERQKHISLR
jgi:hypothetical protein